MLQSIPIPAAERGQSKKPVASPARQRRLSRPTVKKPQASCSVVAQAFSQIATSARNRSSKSNAPQLSFALSGEAQKVLGMRAVTNDALMLVTFSFIIPHRHDAASRRMLLKSRVSVRSVTLVLRTAMTKRPAE